MKEYKIGDILVGEEYTPDVAEWCNASQKSDNPATVNAIEEREDGIMVYQIQSTRLPPEEEERQRKLARINELQSYLDDTDWYCSRYVDIGTPIPDEIRQQRSDARIEIDRLRHELEPVTVEATDDEPTSPTDSPTD